VNWVKKGATTHIKQQGECGSCWTYSAVAVVESYLLIKGKGTTDLSEQQLVDCQKKQSYGCDGGQ
jgi:C1A family cysteine protease